MVEVYGWDPSLSRRPGRGGDKFGGEVELDVGEALCTQLAANRRKAVLTEGWLSLKAPLAPRQRPNAAWRAGKGGSKAVGRVEVQLCFQRLKNGELPQGPERWVSTALVWEWGCGVFVVCVGL